MQKYRVTLNDRPDPIEVEVKFIDMCVAETEAPRHGIPTDPTLTPMSLSLVWIWCALRRMGSGVGEFQHFRGDLLDDVDSLNAAAAAVVEGDPAADPTPPPAVTPPAEHTPSL